MNLLKHKLVIHITDGHIIPFIISSVITHNNLSSYMKKYFKIFQKNIF